MSQTSVNIDHSKAYAGLRADIRGCVTESYRAQGNVEFGLGVVSGDDPEHQARTPKKDVATVLYDADFVSLNSIALSVNGVAITPEVFDTDQATTLAALVAAVDALEDVTCVSTVARTLTIEAEGTDVVVISTVTLGASQAVASYTYATDDVFKGFARHSHDYEQNLASDVKILDKEMFGVMEWGAIWVPYIETPVVDGVAYVVAGGTDTGKITSVTTGNLATDWVIKSVDTLTGLVMVKNTK